METEVLLFEIDGRLFGVGSRYVKEVVRAVKLAPLAQPSATIEGLLNLRRTIVPVIDARALFGCAPRAIHYCDHLVILQAAGRLLALRVDRAIDLVRLAESDWQAGATVLETPRLVEAIGKVGDAVVHILDVGQLAAIEATAAPIPSGKSGFTESSP